MNPLVAPEGSAHGRSGTALSVNLNKVALLRNTRRLGIPSVTRAAEKCFVSQPPMTRQIRALEDELREKLFERRTRGMQLTQEGERLLRHARSVLELVKATPGVVRRGG